MNMVYSSILTFSCLWAIGCQSLTFSNFNKDTICDVTEKVARGCSKEVTGVRSLLQCVTLCGRNVSCIGASFDGEGKCFLHEDCLEVGECTTPNTSHHFMAKHCLHGTWDVSTRKCKCVGIFMGDRCEKYPKTCSRLIDLDYKRGTYKIHIDPEEDGHDPFPAYCFLSGGGSSYHNMPILQTQLRMNFNRTWKEYKEGFYEDEFNFWAGFDSWHKLSRAGYRQLTNGWYSTPNSVYRVYDNFVMSNESSNYSYTFSTTYASKKGNPPAGVSAENCLALFKDTPFSTMDRDNDDVAEVNCASRSGSGWWYAGCDNPCNMLGYGFEHWNDKPSYQLMSMLGIAMNQDMMSQIDMVSLYLKYG